jgi:hypothetical protein
MIVNSTFKAAINVNLKGVTVSSGWMDPVNQVNYYDSLLYTSGVVSNRFRDICSSIQTKGIVNIYQKLYLNVDVYSIRQAKILIS